VEKDKGDLDGALADFNKAIELNARLAYAYNNRGLVKETKGDLVGALADLTKALELKPGNVETQKALDEVKARMTR
jgi:tetratricopeptide (TPR) repeat protein